MTGLDVFNDHIIEICCVITDGDLNLLDSFYESVVHYDEPVLGSMNEWCIDQHGKSGLTKKVLESSKTLAQVNEELLGFLQQHVPKGEAVLAGNSVHMDRAFMMREFPQVIDHLHYRIIDVSSIYEVARRHNPALLAQCPKKDSNHTAKSDILESINQLKWFKQFYLRGPEPQAEALNPA